MSSALVLVDQLIKNYVEDNLSEGEKKPFVCDVIELRKHHNKGLAMNKCSDKPELVKLFSAMSAGSAIGAVLLAFLKGSNKIRKTGLVLVMAGGISNLYDRFMRGYVVDYLGLKKGPDKLKTVTFNLADIMIASGSVLALFPGKSRKKRRLLNKR